MKPIRPNKAHEQRLTDSNDLLRIARLFSGDIRVQCAQCREWLRLTVENRSLRLGSSPDLSQIDPDQPGRPRLMFYCMNCRRIMGFIEADHWVPEEQIDGVDEDGGATRWNHLELDDNDTRDR